MLSSRVFVARRAALGVRSLSGYVQPPLNQGKGGPSGVVPGDEEQATGREREELAAFAEGHAYFNRSPVQVSRGQGTFSNPVMVPSEEHERIVGMIPKGQDGPLWFNVKGGEVNYVPELDMHFKLYNPAGASAHHH